jgi:hypothetical protein
MQKFSSVVSLKMALAKVPFAVFVSTSIALLSACGSGGENASADRKSVTSSITAVLNTNDSAGFAEYKPDASTMAAKSVNSNLTFEASSIAQTGQGCATRLSNRVVYEQTHTAVFAAEGVSDAEQQEVAQYAEQAAVELRAIWPNALHTGFFNNKKVHICVQREAFNGTSPAAAATLVGNTFAGVIYIQSATRYFAQFGNRSSVTNDYKQPTQEIYRRTLAHEMTHLSHNFRSSMPLDQWFSEGVAKWIEFGKTADKKNDILTLLAKQNPVSVAWPMSDNRQGLISYSASAAIISYLLSPEGANNPVSAVSVLLDNISAADREFITSCSVSPAPPDCLNSNFEARRSATFVAAFESSFKERDGTPMKLRTGANNLQDTISTRISTFW